MQFNTAQTPGEVAEARRLLGNRSGWRLLRVNLYATILAAFALGLLIYAAAERRRPDWAGVGVLLALAAFRFGISWSKRTVQEKKAFAASGLTGGTVSLDHTGVKTQLMDGTSTFQPWSAFTTYKLGEQVFLLRGKTAMVVGAMPENSREMLRGTLASYLPNAPR
jgi:hypothetical protein